MMLQFRRLLALFCVLLVGMAAQAEDFRYRYQEGDAYRVLSTVRERVFVNGQFSHEAEILNRIAVKVTKINGTSGYHVATFLTSEQGVGAGLGGGVFKRDQEYPSEFWRDDLGVMTIEPRFFMPIVRNVPRFSGRDLREGDTWSSPGEEVHDFRQPWGMMEPFRFPIQVNYTFLGQREYEGGKYDAIKIEYSVFYRVRTQAQSLQALPSRIAGTSTQTLYWDRAKGMPHAYEEQFDLELQLSDGSTVEFVGSASAKVIESALMNRQALTEEIGRELASRQVPNVSVRGAEEGVVISLDDIRFEPDSARLLPSEVAKIEAIADILKRYPDRDLTIAGHTALAGTEAGRQLLSEQRAAAVGNYLLRLGVRSRERMTYRGYGATVPRGDNATDSGRALNRRVEIIIMEN